MIAHFEQMSAQDQAACGQLCALLARALLDEFIAALEASIPDDIEGLTLKIKISTALDFSPQAIQRRIESALAATEKPAP